MRMLAVLDVGSRQGYLFKVAFYCYDITQLLTTTWGREVFFQFMCPVNSPSLKEAKAGTHSG